MSGARYGDRIILFSARLVADAVDDQYPHIFCRGLNKRTGGDDVGASMILYVLSLSQEEVSNIIADERSLPSSAGSKASLVFQMACTVVG